MPPAKLSMPLPKLRVVQLASGDLWAGAEAQFYTLCKALMAREDVELHAILFNEGELADQLRAAGITPVVLDERRLSTLAIFRDLLALIRQVRPHVVHTHRFKENILGGIAAALSGAPSVRTQHGALETAQSKANVRAVAIHALDVLTGRFLQKRVIAVTEDLRTKLLNDYPQQHVITIPNGIDFTPLDQTVPLDLGQNRSVGIVGRLTQVKRIDLFLEMASRLSQSPQSQPVQFYVVGSGPLHAQLKEHAHKLGLTNHIHFTGHVSPASPWIKALSVLVMCSDHEGMPMTLLEAMRLRTPIVAHAVGGLSELLGSNQCAELVTEHSAEGYCVAVERLLRERERALAMAARAYDHVSANLSAEANAEQIARVYRSVARPDPDVAAT